MNQITMKLNADKLIMMALQEDITSEDVSTNAVMPKAQKGKVDLICKQDGIIAGLDVYARVFTLLDDSTEVEFFCKDGDEVKAGQLMGIVTGDIRVLLSGERVALNYLQRMSGILHIPMRLQNFLREARLLCWIPERPRLIAVYLRSMQSELAEAAITDTICRMEYCLRIII